MAAKAKNVKHTEAFFIEAFRGVFRTKSNI